LIDRGVQFQPALFNQLHSSGRRDWFGHRRQIEHRIECHGDAVAQTTLADSSLIKGLFRIGNGGYDTGNITPGYGVVQYGIGILFERFQHIVVTLTINLCGGLADCFV
jgi:hypothetical protein